MVIWERVKSREVIIFAVILYCLSCLSGLSCREGYEQHGTAGQSHKLHTGMNEGGMRRYRKKRAEGTLHPVSSTEEVDSGL